MQLRLHDLSQQLADHIDDIPRCKSIITQGERQIRRQYPNSDDARDAIAARTGLIDSVLTTLWRALFNDVPYALVAVGGYGRAELQPYSDIDFMVLLDEQCTDEALIGNFIMRLWDLGLDIGYSVRTIDQCVEESLNDVTVITNLMESRLLSGNHPLFEQMHQRIQPEFIWSADDFLRAKKKEQEQRHLRANNISFRLEPNIKESEGGIRDIQTIRWITQRYFGSSHFETLIEQGLLDSEELDHLKHAEGLLQRIRFMLHRVAERREDRLLFDFQRDLAHAFGYFVDKNNQSIEEFMQEYYRTVTAMRRLNELLLQLLEEALPENRQDTAVVAIDEHFQIRKQRIEAVDDTVFKNHPPALLELFLHLSNRPEVVGVGGNTIRLVRRHLCLIDDYFRSQPQTQQLFIEILAKSTGVTHQLRRMNSYGVLAAYLPAFEQVVGRMQYDLFHIYTVDEHTLMVIRNLRRFCLDKHRDEIPHCSDVMKNIKRPELLFLMGLFHDIAKGRGGDHSELGAKIAWDFCIQHGLGREDAGLVQWAVANHLIMSMTIQRRDISDPEIIYQFAQQVHSMRHLDYLYLLTVADIRGTNPDLWNSWKESLLKSLYISTRKLLETGELKPVNEQKIIAQNRQKAHHLLIDSGVDAADIARTWAKMGDKYFLRYYPDEIHRQTLAIIAHGDSAAPLILIQRDKRFNSTEIFCYCPDKKNLFAIVTTVLDELDLDITSARIVTSKNDYALNRFRVLDNSGNPIADPKQLAKIQSALEKILSLDGQIVKPRCQKRARRMQHFTIPVSVEFDNTTSNRTTLISITATDIPGALSIIAHVFLDFDIAVHAAKIATYGEKIEDAFFISHNQGQKVTDTMVLSRLEQALINKLSV